MAESADRSLKSLARRLRLDLSPLREFRDFRLLLGSGLITTLGTVITTVAVPYQMKQLTESYVAVGLVGTPASGAQRATPGYLAARGGSGRGRR